MLSLATADTHDIDAETIKHDISCSHSCLPVNADVVLSFRGLASCDQSLLDPEFHCHCRLELGSLVKSSKGDLHHRRLYHHERTLHDRYAQLSCRDDTVANDLCYVTDIFCRVDPDDSLLRQAAIVLTLGKECYRERGSGRCGTRD